MGIMGSLKALQQRMEAANERREVKRLEDLKIKADTLEETAKKKEESITQMKRIEKANKIITQEKKMKQKGNSLGKAQSTKKNDDYFNNLNKPFG